MASTGCGVAASPWPPAAALAALAAAAAAALAADRRRRGRRRRSAAAAAAAAPPRCAAAAADRGRLGRRLGAPRRRRRRRRAVGAGAGRVSPIWGSLHQGALGGLRILRAALEQAVSGSSSGVRASSPPSSLGVVAALAGAGGTVAVAAAARAAASLRAGAAVAAVAAALATGSRSGARRGLAGRRRRLGAARSPERRRAALSRRRGAGGRRGGGASARSAAARASAASRPRSSGVADGATRRACLGGRRPWGRSWGGSLLMSAPAVAVRRRRRGRRERLSRRAVGGDPLVGPADPALGERAGRTRPAARRAGPRGAGWRARPRARTPGSGASAGVGADHRELEDGGAEVVGDLLALALPGDRERRWRRGWCRRRRSAPSGDGPGDLDVPRAARSPPPGATVSERSMTATASHVDARAGSSGVRPLGQRRPGRRSAPSGSVRSTSRYSASDSWPVDSASPKCSFGPGREALGVGDRAARPGAGPAPTGGRRRGGW